VGSAGEVAQEVKKRGRPGEISKQDMVLGFLARNELVASVLA
jgi:hypothetical protein